MKTRTKVAGARAIYRALRVIRAIPPAGECIQVRRSEVRWELNLSEGIDFSIYLMGAFEQSTLNALQQLVKPGDTVFDIGANIGAHTLHLARSVGSEGRVFAFEPTDFAYCKLRRNLTLNPELAKRVTPLQVFLVDAPGKQQQHQTYAGWPLEPHGNVHPKHLGRLENTSNAHSETLDGFAALSNIDRLDLIKIDVDGHEFPVLKGGRELLNKFSPPLVMEVSPYAHCEEGNSFEDFIALLRDGRYTLTDLNSRKPVKLDTAHLCRMIPDGAGINVIALADRK